MTDPLFNLPRQQIQRIMELLFNCVVSSLNDNRGVHLETAIAGTGAMGGLYLLRAARLPIDTLPVGQPVFSDAVNDSGPDLIGFASGVASMMGFSNNTWDTPIPQDHEPLRTVPELTKILEPAFYAIFHKEKIEESLFARFSIITGMDMLKQGEKILQPEVGKAILLRSIIAGSKTVPTPFKQNG
jgi:hypothetical protein